MKILHTVEYYHPSVGGAQEVVRQISERLVGLGHEVTVTTTKIPGRKISTYNGVKIVEFDVHGKEISGYSGRDVEKYKKFLVESNFDVIMNYAAQQWATDLMFAVLNKVKAAKVLVPCGFSGLFSPSFEEYFKKMPAIMKKYDATVYLSDNYRDIDFARRHKVKNTVLIPNGAGKDEFKQPIDFNIRKRLGIPDKHFLIMTVGSHTGEKGHAEAIEIFAQSRIRNATLLIAANDFGKGCAEQCKMMARRSRLLPKFIRSRKRLIVKELPRIDTVAAYRSADLFLFPSNIEASPLVLFEAMASKLPFLTTDVGNAVEIIKWSRGGELLPTQIDNEGYSHADIIKSAEKLTELYNDKNKISSLAKNGYSAWEEKFTWEIITKQYENLYRKVSDL